MRRIVRYWRPGRLLVLIPVALVVGIVVVDVAPEPDIHLGPLLIVAPAITASFAGPWLVALISLLAIGGEVVTGGSISSQDRSSQLVAMAVVSAFIVFYSLLRERRRRELDQVRTVSDLAHRVLMRPLPERVGPLRIASLYVTAEREAQIGGDLYGAARVGDGTRLIIGDVRGKGLTAIDTTAQVLGAFRAAAHQRATLTGLVAFLDNAVLVRPLSADEAGETPDSDECFVTAVLLDVPDDRPGIHVVNRGHPPPLLLHNGTVAELYPNRPAPPLGLGALAPGGDDLETFPFGVGDVLLLYTDGVIEARDSRGVFYPLADRLSAGAWKDPADLVRRLHDDLRAHTGGRLADDVAVIAVERSRLQA